MVHRRWRTTLRGAFQLSVAADLTSHRTQDCTRVPALLQQTDHLVASICADGAYDREGVYEAAQMKGHGQAVRVLIAPARDARLRRAPSRGLRERNRNIRSIRDLGRREWYKRSGYSKRSTVENAIYRYKTILGRGLRSRGLEGQPGEVQLGCGILNRMALLAMPDSYKVA